MWNNFITGHFVNSLQKRKFPQVKMCKLYAKLRQLKEKGKRARLITFAVTVFLFLLLDSLVEQRSRSEVLVCSLFILQPKNQVSPYQEFPGLCLLALLANTKLSFKFKDLLSTRACFFSHVVFPWRSFSGLRRVTPDRKWEQNWDVWHYIKRSIGSLNKTNTSFEVV